MWQTLQKLLQQYGDNKLVIAIVSAFLGVVLTKLIPFLWGLVGKMFLKCGKMIGGRFAYREFEKRYLDWIVTELRELRLTGIVSYDDAKKPQLEQVFVSLQVGEQRERSSSADTLETAVREVYKTYGAFPP
jgi:hypothetical protein